MVTEGFHGNRGLVPSSPSVRLWNFSALPTTDTAGVRVGEGEAPWKSFMPAVPGWIS